MRVQRMKNLSTTRFELIYIFNYIITILCIINYYSIIYTKLFMTSYNKNSEIAYRKL